jgi:hypothetical protein
MNDCPCRMSDIVCPDASRRVKPHNQTWAVILVILVLGLSASFLIGMALVVAIQRGWIS